MNLAKKQEQPLVFQWTILADTIVCLGKGGVARTDLRRGLLLPNHEAERRAGKLVGLAQLILQIFQI